MPRNRSVRLRGSEKPDVCRKKRSGSLSLSERPHDRFRKKRSSGFEPRRRRRRPSGSRLPNSGGEPRRMQWQRAELPASRRRMKTGFEPS